MSIQNIPRRRKTPSISLAAVLWLGVAINGRSDTFYHFASPGFTVNESDGTATITIVRMGDTNEFTDVFVLTSDGTALAYQDYTPLEPQYLGFEPGQTNASFTIPILNDALKESNETVVVTFIDDPHGLFVDAVLIIVDDDRGVEFSAATYAVNEPDGFVTIPVRRQGDFSGPFTVDFWTSDGPAGTADYVVQSGTLSFAAGETNRTITIAIVNDARREGDEQFWLTLSNATGGAWLGFVTNALITIHDNDSGVEFSSAAYSVNERDGFATITIRRGSDSVGIVTVEYSTANGSAHAGADFIAQAGTLSFAAGESNKTFTVPILNDYLGEGDETVVLTLSNVTGDTDPGDASHAVLTIHDDDDGPDTGLDRWVRRNPLPIGNSLYGVAYGSNVFVAVGEAGTVITSTNSVQWSEQVSGTTQTLSGITWGNGMFVACGNGGVILTSPEGRTWTLAAAGTASLLGLTYGNGKFVTVGSLGAILTSTDAIHWDAQTSGVVQWLFEVTYGNGMFVAVGYGAPILSSADGVTWSQTGPARSLSGVSYGDGTFVAVGYGSPILTSSDGTQWTAGVSSYMDYVAYGNGRFVGAGQSTSETAVSTNSLVWTFHSGDGPFYSVAYGNGVFVGVGSRGTIATTVEGEVWTPRSQNFTYEPLKDVTFANGLFVAVGGDAPSCRGCGGQDAGRPPAKDVLNSNPYATILTSTDGATWSPSATADGLLGVTYGNGQFVAVGSSYSWWFGTYATLLTSVDATNWSYVSLTNYVPGLHSTAWGNGTFVAVGDYGAVVSSTHGTNWSRVPTGTFLSLKDVTYGAGQFVAVGEMILTSADGTSWNPITNVPAAFLSSVAYGHEIFVAVGRADHLSYQGAILTSPDGIVWTRRDEGRFSNSLTAVTCASGTFVAINDHETLASPDGINWTVRSTTAGGLGVAGGNGTFVTVGANGSIWQSGSAVRPGFRTPAVQRLPEGAMHLVVEAEPVGAVVMLEASADLSTWLPLVTLTNFTGTVEFTDGDAMNHPRRFYRAVQR